MKTVILRGPVLSESGYGVHARQVARWLLSRHDIDPYFYLVQWGNTPWMINPELENGLVGRIVAKSMPCPTLADVSYQVQLPNEWDPKLARFNVGVTAGVETDRCNPKWIEACNSMNLIVVPSAHIQNCLMASGRLTVPVIVIPESFHDEIAKADVAAFDPGLTTDFNFLVFGQLTGNNPYNDRKNTLFTIKWLCEEFTNDPTTGIVIKTNSGRESKIDRQITSDTIRKLISEVRRGPFPKFHLLHGRLTNDQVAGLYRNPKVKALVTATRGEGFGLPVLEAAASGLPVIATGWSGHMDFMSRGKFVKLDYTLKDIHESRLDDNIFMKGSRWAEVDENDFKKKIRKFRGASGVPRQWAQELQPKLLSSHSQAAINAHWDKTLP